MSWQSPTPQNKASAARESKRSNAKRRDVLLVRRMAGQLGRTPTKIECIGAGIWFGPRNLWVRYKDLVTAAELEHRPTGVRVTPYRKVGPRPAASAPERDSGTRRCHGCDQLTTWAESCPHCGMAWNRTRRAA